MKRLDLDYKGFRGFRNEPNRPGKTPLEAVTCTVCGHKRNVPRGMPLEQRDGFVCASCTEEGREPEEPSTQQ
jgi:hypothetical protein